MRFVFTTLANGSVTGLDLPSPETATDEGIREMLAGLEIKGQLDGPVRNPSGFILACSAEVNDPEPVPEPSTLAFIGIGVVALGIRNKVLASRG